MTSGGGAGSRRAAPADALNTTSTAHPAAPAARRPLSPEKVKILQGCRDMAVERLVAAFSAMVEKLIDMLIERSGKTDAREEQQVLLDARVALSRDRASLMAEFEKRLRGLIDRRIEGRDVKLDFSKLDGSALSLVDHLSMEETVITSNIVRVVENSAHEELIAFNRGMGSLLDTPDLETEANPLAPATVVEAFAEALTGVRAEDPVKFQILKELNQASLTDVAAIYAELNRHLTHLGVMPAAGGRAGRRGAERPRTPSKAAGDKGGPGGPAEVDVMSLFRKMASQGSFPMSGAPSLPMVDVPGAGPGGPFGGGMPPGESSFAPLRATPSGYIPGAPIISTVDLHEGLTRLQAGQTDFDVGGAQVSFSGVPQGTHNVLRDLQESPLGRKANQLESMTIEMVAMLFDFIFETRDLPDGIKAQLARLQIPVLKAAMLDGAFFAKKSHPSRLLVNALAAGGPRLVAGDGQRRRAVSQDRAHRPPHPRRVLRQPRAVRRAARGARGVPRRGGEGGRGQHRHVGRRDQPAATSCRSPRSSARAEIERRIENYPVPQFLASFLREHWQGMLEHVYLKDGDESESWTSALTTLEDLVWSVQPKRSPEDRKHLVALLPSLLKRLSAGVHNQRWTQEQREQFMQNLVEAHAAAVKPSFAAGDVADGGGRRGGQGAGGGGEGVGRHGGGGEGRGARRGDGAGRRPRRRKPIADIVDDEYLEIARNLERGMWVEFESEDGQLAFAKLAWVSPLRGTYLFTNRQGQKALSMTAEELAERFRADRARLVEAEPLVDRAMTRVITDLTEKMTETADAM